MMNPPAGREGSRKSNQGCIAPPGDEGLGCSPLLPATGGGWEKRAGAMRASAVQP
jgi:hypothetical protein